MKKSIIGFVKYLINQSVWFPFCAFLITSIKFAGTFMIGRYWTKIEIEDNKLKLALLRSLELMGKKRYNHYRADRLWDSKVNRRYVAMIGLEPYTVVRYEGKLFVVHYHTSHQVAADVYTPSSINGDTPESYDLLQVNDKIVLFALNSSEEDIRGYLEHVESTIVEKQDKTLWIYTNSDHGWNNVGPLNNRGLDSIILPKEKIDSLVADIDDFLDEKEWYEDHGIKYKRGYMFYGPPGTGKTSLTTAIANKYELHVYVLKINKSTMSDQSIQRLIRDVPKNALILIEDIDSAFTGRDQEAIAKGGYSVTFSGILEMLDGVTSENGRIVFMTTNHPENLDPALLRPGRVDFELMFESATHDQIMRLLERFYPDMLIPERTDMATKFLERTDVTIAEIQQFIQRHKRDYQAAYLDCMTTWDKYGGRR